MNKVKKIYWNGEPKWVILSNRYNYGPGPSHLGYPSSPESIAVHKNAEIVMRLRGEGVTFREIGKRIGVSRQMAWYVYKRFTTE